MSHDMRAITINAKSFASAREIFDALSEFDPELIGKRRRGLWCVGSNRRRPAGSRDSRRAWGVTSRHDGPARLELDGRRCTMHAEPEG